MQKVISPLLERVRGNPDFEKIEQGPLVLADIRYASIHNFVGEDLYGPGYSLYLHQIAAQKFKRAVLEIEQLHPGWKFLVFDALRPVCIQQKLWNFVAGTAQEKYVANPNGSGSNHSYGFAIDLTLVNPDGQEVDMGTAFDSFEEKAEPQLESDFVKSGELTTLQLENRLKLRGLMLRAGFTQLPSEWWHFDALPRLEIRQKFQLIP
jgi:D-alanyl-D-alanine dipeptidase